MAYRLPGPAVNERFFPHGTPSINLVYCSWVISIQVCNVRGSGVVEPGVMVASFAPTTPRCLRRYKSLDRQIPQQIPGATLFPLKFRTLGTDP